MQVLEAGVCQLSNYEVYTSLQEWRGRRGAEQILPSEAVFALETSLLRTTFKTEKGLGREQVDAFVAKLDELCSKYPSPNGEPMYLTPAEKIQLLNVKPRDVMGLELAIEGMLTDERVEEPFVDQFANDVLACVEHYLLLPEYTAKAKDTVYISSSEDEDGDGGEERKKFYDPTAVLTLHADGLPTVVAPVKESEMLLTFDEPMEGEKEKEKEEEVEKEGDVEMVEEEAPKKEEKEKEEEKGKGKKKPAKKPSRSRKKRDPSTDSSASEAAPKKPKAKGKRNAKKKPSPPPSSSSESSSSSSDKKRKKKKKSATKSKSKSSTKKKK